MDYHNKDGVYYFNERPEMLEFFPKSAKKVLDIGCGQGTFAVQLKNNYQTETWGIEYMQKHGEEAAKFLDKVFIGPCELYLDELPDNYFDAIYFNDVLEHLVDPYMVLEKIKSKLTDNGVIISSIPNIRYHGSFKMYLFDKDWKYADSGVMDHTHMRFFTKKSIERMYRNLGYKILTHKGINRTRSLKPYLFNLLFLFTASDIFYTQYATVVKK